MVASGAELVCSEEMLTRRWLELAEDVGRDRVVRRDQIPEDRADDPDAGENAADQKRRRPDEEAKAFVTLHLGLVRTNRNCNRSGLFVDGCHSAVA